MFNVDVTHTDDATTSSVVVPDMIAALRFVDELFLAESRMIFSVDGVVFTFEGTHIHVMISPMG